MTPWGEILTQLGANGSRELKEFLRRQRWFAARADRIDTVRVEDWAVLTPDGPLLLLLDVDGEPYYLPVVAVTGAAPEAIARVGPAAVVDAHDDPALGRLLLEAIASGRELCADRGRFLCRPLAPWAGPDPREAASIGVRRLSGEQSNTSIALGRALILKSFRRPRRGVNPELEMTRFLTERTGFRHAPGLVGWVDHADAAGATATVAVLQRLVPNAGDGWQHALAGLSRALDALSPEAATPGARPGDALVGDIRHLGTVTGALHAALASDASLPAFAPERVTTGDTRRWSSAIAGALARLAGDAAAARRHPEIALALRGLTRAGAALRRVSADLERLVSEGTYKIRCHGDYHLGQVLKTPESFAVIDFEGEPARPIEERRAKQSPLRDVAGMLRSFDYAARSALLERPADERARDAPWLERWERRARDAFLDGYLAAVAASPVCLVPPSRRDLARACAAFEIDKACYELAYELDHRPAWAGIPLGGLKRLLAARDDP